MHVMTHTTKQKKNQTKQPQTTEPTKQATNKNKNSKQQNKQKTTKENGTIQREIRHWRLSQQPSSPSEPWGKATGPSGHVKIRGAAARSEQAPVRSGAGQRRLPAARAPAAAQRGRGSRAMGSQGGGPRATEPGQQLRALFYALPPGESSFQTVEEVPDYVEKVRAPYPPLLREQPWPPPPLILRAAAAFFFSKGTGGPRKQCPQKGT